MESQQDKAVGTVSELMPKGIEYQAAHWLAILDGDEPSADDIEAFKQWQNADEAHSQAFKEVLELWGDMNKMTLLKPPLDTARSSAKHRIRFFSPAVLLLLLAVISLVQPRSGLDEATYTTQVGEQKSIPLPDGSQVLLNTDSRVLVNYRSDHRLLTLQKGEAHFEVAHDPGRPFDVYAGDGRVNAVGTAFTVRVQQQGISVFVTEGVVEIFSRLEEGASNTAAINHDAELLIAPQDASGAAGQLVPSLPADPAASIAAGVRVPAGQQAEQSKKKVTIKPSKNMADKLSWRRGKIVFRGESLGAVIEEFSRYTSTKIIISGENMRAKKIGGIFKIGDTVAMLDALKEGFGIHAQYASNDTIYLVYNDE